MGKLFKNWYENQHRNIAKNDALDIIGIHARQDGTMYIRVGKCPIYEIGKVTELEKGIVGIEDAPSFVNRLRDNYIKENS